MGESIMNYTDIVITFISLVVAPCIILLVKSGIQYLTSKTQNETAQKYATEIETIVCDAVSEISQTVVSGLKEKSADGKLTAEEADYVLGLAIEKSKLLMSDELLNYVFSKSIDVETYLTNKIESLIGRIK
jgi:uncharacterized protein YsxB (DUF464 family)